MIDYSISELMQERSHKRPDNALVLVSEDTIFNRGNKIYFHPNSVKVIIEEHEYDVNLTAIPIRKIENDQTLKEVAESLIVPRPNNNYIRVNSINRSISWWITNNSESLEYPDAVLIGYTASDGKPRTMVFEHTARNKWDLTEIKSDTKIDAPTTAISENVSESYKKIMKNFFHENP